MRAQGCEGAVLPLLPAELGGCKGPPGMPIGTGFARFIRSGVQYLSVSLGLREGERFTPEG
jgi:hypothetical protein